MAVKTSVVTSTWNCVATVGNCLDSVAAQSWANHEHIVIDGQTGTAFHFLQGFWYRYLADAKVAEVKRYMRKEGASVERAVEMVLGIKV